jgi:iron complex transport system permease protein
MKITLDLSRLVQDGKLTAAEAERLKKLAGQDSRILGLNILTGFGVMAVAAGLGALLPTALTAIVIGAILFAGGLALVLSGRGAWEILAQICVVVGALTLGFGLLVLDEGSLRAVVVVTFGLGFAAIVAGSGLLAALAVLSVGGWFGAATDYLPAIYGLSLLEPAIVVVVFSVLALVCYLIGRQAGPRGERLALIAAGTALLVVNAGFWVGSLWGEGLRLLRALTFGDSARLVPVPPLAFSIVWALALAAAAIWGVRENRRFVVNAAATFGALHFYTQWFEALGANAASVLAGGLVLLGFSVLLWKFNRSAGR